MRTLSEIIELAQDGGMPTYDECYWAMLAFNSLNNLNTKRLFDIGRLTKEDKSTLKFIIEVKVETAFNSTKTALSVTPQHWLGPSHDPRTEECQKWRKISKGILQHIENRSKP